MHQEVSKEDIERHYNAIKSKTESLMIFGEIHYWDISHKQMHTTQFCVHLRDPDAKLMAFCDFFNDMN